LSVRHHRPRPLFAAIAIGLLLGTTGTVHATTLQHLAASLDLSRIAAPASANSAIDQLALAMPTRTVIPPTIDLLGPTTEVRVGLPHESDMNIEVTNEAGDIVCTASVHMPAGWQKMAFSGRDGKGHLLPNGVYFYRVLVAGEVMVTRVVINR
jgi:hypothetical protein